MDSRAEGQQLLIERLIADGDAQASQGLHAEATRRYYSVFQPALCGVSGLGLRRLAPTELYRDAAEKLRVVAGHYAHRLAIQDAFLAGESASGAVGVPRGALNLYLISNQYPQFVERALDYAAEQARTRTVSRFLMSSVRARLHQLEKVRSQACLLDVEERAFAQLAFFETRLHAQIAPLWRANGLPSGLRDTLNT